MSRPKGSRNKRKLGMPGELAAQLGDRDPFEVLAGVYTMELKQLQRLVRSKAGAAAMALKVRAAEAALPYVHSKMPVKLLVEDDRLPTLVIVRGSHKMQQIQALIDKLRVEVATGEVATEGKVIEHQEVKSHETAD